MQRRASASDSDYSSDESDNNNNDDDDNNNNNIDLSDLTEEQKKIEMDRLLRQRLL